MACMLFPGTLDEHLPHWSAQAAQQRGREATVAFAGQSSGKGPALSSLGEIEDEQQVHRPRFSREPMRKLTEPELDRASPVSPLQLAPVRWPQRTSNGKLSGGTQLFTPPDKAHTWMNILPCSMMLVGCDGAQVASAARFFQHHRLLTKLANTRCNRG